MITIGLKGPAKEALETALLLGAGTIAIGCFEHRVIFRAYHHLFAVVAPWSVIIVTIACYAYAGMLFIVIEACCRRSRF